MADNFLTVVPVELKFRQVYRPPPLQLARLEAAGRTQGRLLPLAAATAPR